MGATASTFENVAELQARLAALNELRNGNHQALSQLLSGKVEPPDGNHSFNIDTAAHLLQTLSKELAKYTTKADDALQRGDSRQASRYLREAEERAQEHTDVMKWVHTLTGNRYFRRASQEFVKRSVPYPLRCTALICGHTCLRMCWNWDYDDWLR